MFGRLERIAQTHVLSGPAEDVFRHYQNKKFTSEQYYTENARLTAENITDYNPERYPSLLPALLNYVDRRLCGEQRRDSVLAIKLGEWILAMLRIREQNEGAIMQCLWAKPYCEKAHLPSHVKILEDQISNLSKYYFPLYPFQRALRVQKLDSDERRRNE